MNLVDSHDTDRLVSMYLNPDRRYDADNREQDGVGYDNRRPAAVHYRRARLTALLQMTYVGAPMVYYGDEVGMWGPDDPSNRKPMLWKDLGAYEGGRENRVDEEHLEHYRRVGQLRREHSALRRGSFETVLCDDDQDLFVFLREDANERVLVALNAGSEPARLELPEGRWRAAYGKHASGSRARVPAIDGLVLVEEQ
jgi:glycosidase